MRAPRAARCSPRLCAPERAASARSRHGELGYWGGVGQEKASRVEEGRKLTSFAVFGLKRETREWERQRRVELGE
eukprot:951041-Rhodomonas_salina.1